MLGGSHREMYASSTQQKIGRIVVTISPEGLRETSTSM
jgi:hypothetical protein